MSSADKNTRSLSRIESLLVRIDESPWDAVCRVVIGFFFVPLKTAILGTTSLSMTLGLFLAVLLSLKLIPAVIRKGIGFSNDLQALWFERRQKAKRYDSYQWRKLFWIGIGLSLYSAVLRHAQNSELLLIIFTLAAGLIGVIRWRQISGRSAARLERTKALRQSA